MLLHSKYMHTTIQLHTYVYMALGGVEIESLLDQMELSTATGMASGDNTSPRVIQTVAMMS